ncbi:MAG: FAD-binding protein [Ottowia sp.]|uniref:FAD-dependent oxidoreductase n=1 Tax=unclassified Ottowia TaxID=2645081 RepID=UPI003C2E112C
MSTTPYDLAILGAGAAGMMAALRASALGLRVAVFDPFWSQPNNLLLSGGLFPAAGSRLQADAGVADSPEVWLEDLRQFAGTSCNERIAASVAEVLPTVVESLLQAGVPVRFLADVPAPGHRTVRFHSVTPASGAALHASLREALGRCAGLQCHPDTGISRIDRGDGRFTLQHAGGLSHARHLLLAGGGFGAAPEMVAEFIPEMAGALHSGAPSQDGSTIALARAWGAALGGMDGYQGQGHTHPDGRTRLGMSIPTLGGIMLNRAGQRFVREDVGPSALAAKVLGQPGQQALEVFDAAIEQRLGNHSAYAAARAAGRVMEADDLEALARQAQVPLAALRESVQLAQRCAQGEANDPLGRTHFEQPLQAPFRASWVTGSLAHTQGGLLTDGDGRVLDAGDRPMAGVYAAGGCAAGLSGHGGDGYLPGNGLAQSFGLALRAVEHLAETSRR